MDVQWGLLDIYPILGRICECSTEYVRPAMQITQSCALLGSSAFLSRHGATVQHVLATLLGNVNERGMMVILPTIDLLLRMFPRDVSLFLQDALTKLLGMVLSGTEEPTVVVASLDVFARVALVGNDHAASFFAHAAAAMGTEAGALVGRLLETWTESFDSIPRRVSRKLSALALSSSLVWGGQEAAKRAADVLACVTGVYLATEARGAPEAAEADQANYGYDLEGRRRSMSNELGGAVVVGAGEEAQGEFSRRQRVYEGDGVRSLRVGPFLRDQLRAAAGAPAAGVLQASLGQLDEHLGRVVREMTGG